MPVCGTPFLPTSSEQFRKSVQFKPPSVCVCLERSVRASCPRVLRELHLTVPLFYQQAFKAGDNEPLSSP